MGKGLGRWLRRFIERDDGSATIEFVLWIPLLFTILIMSVQVSMIATGQSRALRIVQDGGRAFALGRLDGTLVCPAGTTVNATGTQDYIKLALRNLSPRAKVTSRVNCTTLTITNTVQMPFSDLSKFGVLPNSRFLSVTISSQQVKEF